eukprot:gene20230-7271_t
MALYLNAGRGAHADREKCLLVAGWSQARVWVIRCHSLGVLSPRYHL